MAAHLNPIIRGEKVWLRPMERNDIERSLQALNDREVAELLGIEGPMTKEMSEKWFEDEVLKQHGKREYFFTICELGSNDAIGGCGFHHIRAGLRADVGIYLLAELCGRGFGTDAMNALVDFGFGELRFERIGLHVSPGNERAIRSYEKAGFSHEGRLRSYRIRRGEVMDDLVMSILRHEWAALERPRSWDLLPIEAPQPVRPAS